MVWYVSALHRTLPVFPQPMGPRPWKINKGTPQLVSTLSTQLQLLNIYFIRNKSRQTHKAETLFSRAWQLITKTRHKRENLRTTNVLSQLSQQLSKRTLQSNKIRFLVCFIPPSSSHTQTQSRKASSLHLYPFTPTSTSQIPSFSCHLNLNNTILSQISCSQV